MWDEARRKQYVKRVRTVVTQGVVNRMGLVQIVRRLKVSAANRLRQFPFWSGAATVFPGTYRAYVPDRYWPYTKDEQTEPELPSGSKEGFLAGNNLNNGGDLPRYYFFMLVCEQIVKEKIHGDLAELGVYKGNTAILLAHIARQLDTTAYLFDTYGGFSGRDLVGIDQDKRGGAQFNDTSLESVRSLVGEKNVKFIQGRFPDSLDQVPPDRKFSVVHIDCDLHAPFVAALEYFYPRLVSGGFMIMHDYSSRSWNGAEMAVDHFFADKQESVIPLPDKSGTAVVRKH